MQRLWEAVEEPGPDWEELSGTFDYDREKYLSVLTSDPKFAAEAVEVIERLKLMMT